MTGRTADDRFAAFDIALKRRGRSRWKWVCSYDRWTCRHVRFGVQSRRSEIQGGARAVSPAMRQRLALSQVADGAVRFRRTALSRSKDTGTSESLND